MYQVCGKLRNTLCDWPDSGGRGRVRAGRKKRLRRKSSIVFVQKMKNPPPPIGELDGNFAETRPFEKPA